MGIPFDPKKLVGNDKRYYDAGDRCGRRTGIKLGLAIGAVAGIYLGALGGTFIVYKTDVPIARNSGYRDGVLETRPVFGHVYDLNKDGSNDVVLENAAGTRIQAMITQEDGSLIDVDVLYKRKGDELDRACYANLRNSGERLNTELKKIKEKAKVAGE